MKKIIVFLSFVLFALTSFAQNPDARKLVEEGVALHDEGKYDEAIKKYDEALSLDKEDFLANYEKSLSLMYAKRYPECVAACKLLISKFKDNPTIKNVYSNYGSAVDDAGDPKEAIKIYNKGIDKFPDFYLLHFNKGLTYQKMEKYEDALESYTQALKCNPLHPGSHYYMGALLKNQNKIPSLLSFLTFLACEPESKRSELAYDAVLQIMTANVKKDGNNTTIYISDDMLDKKNSKKEDDFSSVEFLFTLMGGVENAEGIDSIASTPASKFDFKLQLLINSLANSQNDGKGFYWKHYVPFFAEMKEKGLTTTLSHIVYMSKDAEAANWLKENPDKVKAFYSWLQDYDWPRK